MTWFFPAYLTLLLPQDVFLLIVFFCIASHTLLRVRAQVISAQRKKQALADTQLTFYLFSSRLAYPDSRRPDSSPASPPPPPLNAAKRSPQVIEVEQTATTSVLFPALKVQPGEKLTKAEAVARRSKALRLVYRSLLVRSHIAHLVATLQCADIHLLADPVRGDWPRDHQLHNHGDAGESLDRSSGGENEANGSSSSQVAVTSYYAARTNQLQKFVEPHYLINCYINICYGCSIVGAVAWRSFDSAFILSGGDEIEEVELEVSDPTDNSRSGSQQPFCTSTVTGESPSWSADAPGHTRDTSIKIATSRERLLSHEISVASEDEAARSPYTSSPGFDTDCDATPRPPAACHFAYDAPSHTNRA